MKSKQQSVKRIEEFHTYILNRMCAGTSPCSNTLFSLPSDLCKSKQRDSSYLSSVDFGPCVTSVSRKMCSDTGLPSVIKSDFI